MRTLSFLLFGFLIQTISLQAEPIVARKILAFLDTKIETIEENEVHITLEMALNYLGIDVIYHDIKDPLPKLSGDDGIVGILMNLSTNSEWKNPENVIEWLIDAMDGGKKVLLLGNPGFLADRQGKTTPLEMISTVYEKIGFEKTGKMVLFPFDYKILFEDSNLCNFEKQFPKKLPEFEISRIISDEARSYLKVGIPDDSESSADLIIISPNGAYVSPGFENSFRLSSENPREAAWYINPFLFFRLALDLKTMPIPDTTTLAGKRIFYHICHGDGFNIETSLEEFQGEEEVYSSKVLLEKVVKTNPDFPLGMGIIAADVDPHWEAKNKSQEVAKEYFLQPQVEACSHTYSHPFSWDFFAPGRNGKDLEIDYLYRYRYPTWQNSYLSWLHAKYNEWWNHVKFEEEIGVGYVTPRAYANEPFSLEKEIGGSIDFLNQLAPKDNQVKSLLWSGDGQVWGEALELCHKAGVKNLGIGWARFDEEYPSYLFVGPTVRRSVGWIQPYNSSNGENEYTYEWQKDFYRFTLLIDTLKNTETPRRVKPMLIYYHSYSGEFASSLKAILTILDFVRSQPHISIFPSRFCEIVEGFVTTEIDLIADSTWRIRNRKGLQTFRFDDIENLTVKFSDSTGVIGYKKHQGSTYVYLDASIASPIIAISQGQATHSAFLVESNWEVWNLRREEHSFTFLSRGWETLKMKWFVPQPGNYSVFLMSQNQVTELKELTSEGNILDIEWNLPFNRITEIKVMLKEPALNARQ